MAELDPEFAALLKSAAKPTKSAYDPSAGGGTFQIGPFDTGLKTPQGLDRFLAGAGQGMTDLVRHAGSLVGLESDQALKDAKAIDAPLLNTGAGRAGQFVGQTAALAPLGMGTGAALGRTGALGARLAANPLASGAIQGATQGALLADPGQRIQGAALGGVAGAALPALGSAIGKVARGITRTPAAQTLLDAGVSLTPGQMNPTGIANRMEQAMEAIPGVGDMAQNARENAMKQYTKAMVERSMAPGAKLSGSAKDFNAMIDEAAKSFDTAYDVGKGYPVGAKIMSQTGPDVPLQQAIKGVVARARPGITGQEQAAAGRNIQDLLSQSIKDARQSGGMQSDDLIKFRSMLRELARGEDTTTNAGRAKSGLYSDAANQVTQALESQIPTAAADAIRAADAQYAKFAIVRNAAKAAKDAPGGPTPFQISNAIAQTTPPNLYAQGGGLNRDLSKAARETFQSNVPRTGLTGIGRVALPLAAAAGMGGLATAHPEHAGTGLGTLAALGALGAAAYSPAGRRAFAGNTALQQALARGLGRIAPPASVANLPSLFGQSALLSGAAPRLQQMPQ